MRKETGIYPNPLIWIVTAGIAASLMMFWIIDLGPGISPDSVVYLHTAKSLLSGEGFFYQSRPMAHFPPLYPMLLAIGGLFHQGDVLAAGRFIIAFLFGVNTILLGISIYFSTHRNVGAVGMAILVFITSPKFFNNHAWMWSEAPFLAFTLIGFILFSFHIVRPRRWLLVVGSISVACAMATRYIGVTLLPPVALALLVLGNRSRRKKVVETIFFIISAPVIVAPWLLRNRLVAGTATNREAVVHLFGVDHLEQLIATLYDFVFPIQVDWWFKAIQMIFFIAITIYFLRRWWKEKTIVFLPKNLGGVLSFICLVFFFTYIGFLVISISFFDAFTPLDSRILMPAYVVFLIPLFSFIWSIFQNEHKYKIASGFFIVIICLSIFVNTIKSIPQARRIHLFGIGFTKLIFRTSETVNALSSVPEDVQIYSNGPDLVNFYFDNDALRVPSLFYPTTLSPNSDFEMQLAQVCAEVDMGKAVIVYFSAIASRDYLPTIQELERRCELPNPLILEDGVLYGQ